MPNAIAYIDGFNLFHALETSGLKQYYWINLHLLCNNLLNPLGYEVELTRYFTARVPDSHPSSESQKIWLDAVESLRPQVQTHFGRFSASPKTCGLCHGTDWRSTEKETDVNLAVRLMVDIAKRNVNIAERKIDASLIITADSDQVPTVHGAKMIDSRYPVYVAFPPGRHSDNLSGAAGKSKILRIDEEILAASLLPDYISDRIQKPAGWVAPTTNEQAG